MKLAFDWGACEECGICMETCPEDAIHLEFDGMRTVDPEKCTGCGACVENCPGGAWRVSMG